VAVAPIELTFDDHLSLSREMCLKDDVIVREDVGPGG
jgi:hypothetical protein